MIEANGGHYIAVSRLIGLVAGERLGSLLECDPRGLRPKPAHTRPPLESLSPPPAPNEGPGERLRE